MLRLAVPVLAVAALAGCGGASRPSPTTSAPHPSAACLTLLRQARSRLSETDAQAVVGDMNGDCSATPRPRPLGDPSEQRSFDHLLSSFSNVAGHRVANAVGYSC